MGAQITLMAPRGMPPEEVFAEGRRFWFFPRSGGPVLILKVEGGALVEVAPGAGIEPGISRSTV